MPAPDGAEHPPLWQQVRELLEAGTLPLHTTRLSGEYVVASYHHECGPLLWADGARSRYQQTIPYGDHCQLCGWGIDLPLPNLDAVVSRLLDAMHRDDALVWAHALFARLEGP